jgi:S1-C subfamily serine protease
MQILTDIFVGLLSAYLAFTNNLAHVILDILPQTEEAGEELVLEEGESGFLTLPSIFNKQSLPDLLLRNSEYQRAAAVASLEEESEYITDPAMALVNIFCTFTSPTTIRTTTGTGFFVHDSGVILTNAHVAQYLLLGSTDLLGDAECIVRQGTPALASFKADLLYIPPTWVQENASLINDTAPLGTGERDYALLYVTSSVNETPLPTSFPALKAKTNLLPRTAKDSEVTVAGYPATALLKNGPNSPLFSVKADTSISELYTFGSNYADVFSIRGSDVGAEGSSGGPVVNSAGEVIGIIVTRGDDAIDGEGSLRAITLSHIQRTILEETGFAFKDNISGDAKYKAALFTNTMAPFLTSLLSEEISR